MQAHVVASQTPGHKRVGTALAPPCVYYANNLLRPLPRLLPWKWETSLPSSGCVDGCLEDGEV